MAVPYTFGSATSSIPLSQLDSNFATAITLGTTNVYLGNTTTTLNGLTLSNVTISSGNVTITSVTLTNANITGTTTLSGLTASTALALDASKNIVSVTNTGTGNNVLAASPTLTGTVTIATLNLTNALGTAYGGTGLTSYTANGVLYASSTSALTSGSALTFDGTGFQLSTSTGGNFYLNSTTTGTSNQIVSLLNNGNSYGNLNYKAFDHIWSYGVTEQMRLTSTGLGIGTSSPAVGLDVTKAGVKVGATTAYKITSFRDSTPNKGVTLGYDSGSQTGIILGDTNSASSNLAFWTYEAGVSGWAERMRLDSSGNLGLGVTPSAWGSAYKVIDAQSNGGSFGASGYAPFVACNAYQNGTNWIYKGSSFAPSYYSQFNGSHIWYNAPTGTAGNAITFTQAMTLDASGNLGVGTTSANSTLNVVGPQITFDTNVFGQVLVRSTAAYNATPRAGIAFSVKYNSVGNYIAGGSSIQGYKQTAADGEFANGLLFTTQAEGQAPAERARIDSSGNLLVGQTSWAFANNGTQIAQNGRIFNTSSTDYNMEMAGAQSGRMRFYTSAGGSATTVGSITVSTSTTAYNTSSDYRLKENIQPMTGALAKVAALKPVTYTWKADGSAGEGFIAHELQEVCPQAVTGEKDAVDAEGKPVYQGIDVSFLVGTLTAAIQELNAKVQALEAKLASK